MIYNSSVDALRHLVSPGYILDKSSKINQETSRIRCKITDKPKKISFTRDGIEYYLVEITCDDGSQYGIQAFGDEALELFSEVHKCTLCGRSCVNDSSDTKHWNYGKEELSDGACCSFDTGQCALLYMKFRCIYGESISIIN
jgi:hypothetical protein